jgi:RNA polymerase sigma factor (TIGR02999 family)
MKPEAEPTGEVTRLLRQIEGGDRQAPDELLPLVYRELRSLARARMARESPGQTLDPTGLVHEAYLRLLQGADPSFSDRAHFFAAAAQAMRRILIERARRRASIKHGGGERRVPLDPEQLAAAVEERADEVLALDQALGRLETLDSSMAEVVRLRYFAGLSVAETAALLARSQRSIERSWTAARAWLNRELGTVAPG